TASDSKRYSPASLVVVVRLAPVAWLVIVTSALLPMTACVLSVIVPCRLALAVTWPKRLMLPSSTRQHMIAMDKHRLLIISVFLLNRWILTLSVSAFSPACFKFGSGPCFDKEQGDYQSFYW